MTSSHYFIARFAQAFGFFRKNLRMADAASEMHLLREAEAQLGWAIWEKVESIEELSVEYWNLRKFIKERDLVAKKLIDCQARLDAAHEERATVLTNTPEIHQELIDSRTTLLAEIDKLAIQRDEIVVEARNIRRSYDGLKMKLEVLTNEFSGLDPEREEIARVKGRLLEHKAKFAELKQFRIDIGRKIEVWDGKLDAIDTQFTEKRMSRRADASEAFQVIGEGNKQMSVLRAENAVLETQMRQLYAEIGRYVSHHARQSSACASAASSHQGLVDVMRALRRSIALNHRLAGTA